MSATSGYVLTCKKCGKRYRRWNGSAIGGASDREVKELLALPMGRDNSYCSHECWKADGSPSTGGCAIGPIIALIRGIFKAIACIIKLFLKLFFNKWILTLCTCGVAYLLYKLLNRVYGKKD